MVHGSRVIFTGPHKAFTEGNSKDSQFSYAICENRDEFEYSKYVPYSMIVDKQSGIEIHPTPTTGEDIIDVGGQVDEYRFIAATYCTETGLEAHFFSDQKAMIPITAMRQLIDQDDQSQLVTFKCSDMISVYCIQ